MCSLCEEVKGLSEKEALNAIAARAANRGMNRHLSELLDRVLDTQVESTVDSAREGRAFRAMKEAAQDPE